MPGPVPKRSDERRRRNKSDVETLTGTAGVVAVAPEADEGWHPLAVDWFRSLAESGQAQWYQPSDWQQARVWAELLSRQLMSDKMNSQIITAWSAGATELLTTEGARRRARVELARAAHDADEEASVTLLDSYRADLA